MKKHSVYRWSFAWVVVLLAMAGQAWAINDITQLKLYGHWTGPAASPGVPSGYETGAVGSTAINETWVVMGAPFASDQAYLQGAVQVFNATTGAWVRKIQPPVATGIKASFGATIALKGNIAAIGAANESFGSFSNAGAVYIYNVATGALLRRIQSPSPVNAEAFGGSVAITGNTLLVGAYGSGGGIVYLFDLTTYAPLSHTLGLSTPGSGDVFGQSIAVQGTLALVGAPGRNVGKGGAYLFDLNSTSSAAVWNPLVSYEPAGLTANDQMGYSVAMSDRHVFIGAPNRGGHGSVFYGTTYSTVLSELADPVGGSNDLFGSAVAADAGLLLVAAPGATASTITGGGTAYVFEFGADAPHLVRHLTAPDLDSSTQGFGGSVALCGSTALIGSPQDHVQASFCGAGYLMRPILAPFTRMTKVAAKGESAPGAPDTSFNTLGDAFVNGTGAVAFASTLTGTGSHGGADNGIWTTLKAPAAGSVQLMAKSGSTVPGLVSGSVATMAPPVFNESGSIIALATMKTAPGVTTANNKWIIDQGTTGSPLFYGSTSLPVGGVTTDSMGHAPHLSAINELVQSNHVGQDNWAFAATFKVEAATGTDATNDSGVVRISGNASSMDGVREKDLIPGGGGSRFGQMTGRVAYHYNDYLVSAATNDTAASNQVIVRCAPGTGALEIVAKKGGAVSTIVGTPFLDYKFSGFLGEAANGGETAIFRATISGTNVTAANNEVLYVQYAGGAGAGTIMQKGQDLGGGLRLAGFINAWIVRPDATPAVLALVKLGGTGVTTANDQALLLFQENLSYQILLREGDPAQGAGTGAIGVISRVDVDPYSGYYAVLCTLAGAPAGTDQALYTGEVGAIAIGSPGLFPLRRPVLYLRKGWQFDGQPGKIRSISLPSTVTASGIGGTGRSRAITYSGYITATVEFDNGVRQIMVGQAQ